MQFNVIVNRKGEKVLKINGFKRRNDALEGYGDEADDRNQEEENTLFINLNRLFDQQEQSALQQQTDDIINSSIIEDPHRINEFMTQNPVTKAINMFPGKIKPELIAQIEMGAKIAAGAHANVFRAEYLQTPVAIKVYDHSKPINLHAFNAELEAYYQGPPAPPVVMAHPSVVQVLGAY